MEILKCEHISKIYGKGNTCVKALDDVSFSVEKGEFVSIIGPSGSGKSTLLHILGGVDKPSEGRVLIDGTDIHGLNEDKLAIFRRRQIGLVYQFYNLLPVLNVDENIVLPHLLDGRKMEQERLDMMVEYLGLTDRRKNLPSQLSGGQQQRVSIGRALFNHPAIILADEPTGNLDRKNGEEIMRLLKDSNRKQKQTLILITHNGNETDWAQKLQALSEQDNAEFYISKAGENAMMVSVAEAVAYIIKILAVCFVILTSVICILNLYNSIWGRVVSRKQEFGTLKSLGMTRKQMVKMLFYENVGLFLKGTLWSGVISIPVIYLLRHIISGYLGYVKFAFPWMIYLLAIGIAAVSLGVITVYCYRRNGNEIIIEELRRDTV